MIKNPQYIDDMQELLLDYYYPVTPIESARNSPVSAVILGVSIVIWMEKTGSFACCVDQCPHRSARLSLGQVSEGLIECPYHGWSFNKDGKCVKIPQRSHPHRYRHNVKAFKTQVAYGFVWVCLGEPCVEIPSVQELRDTEFIFFHEFTEEWDCSWYRVIENAFDLAHVAYVHRKTFGQTDSSPEIYSLNETPTGFKMTARMEVSNPKEQQDNILIESPFTVRNLEMEWFAPAGRYMRIEYPNGVVHTILGWAVPVKKNRCRVIQFAFRNEQLSPSKIKPLINWDYAINQEDRVVLESTSSYIKLDVGSTLHTKFDRPNILIRQWLKKKEMGQQ